MWWILTGMQSSVKRLGRKNKPPGPDPAAAEVFAGLKNLGYRLGVISNSDGSIESAMKKFGFAPFLECMIDSHVVGVAKRVGIDGQALEPVDPREFVLFIGGSGMHDDSSRR